MHIAHVYSKLALFVHAFLVYLGFDTSKLTATGFVDGLDKVEFGEVALF